MSEAPLLLLRVAGLPFEALAALEAGAAADGLDDALALEEGLAAEVEDLCDELFREAGEAAPEMDLAAARARLDVIALRRAIHNGRPVPAQRLEKAAGRLRPELMARLRRHAARREESLQALAAARQRFAEDLVRVRAALLELANRPRFRMGIRLVGRALLERLDGPDGTNGMTRRDPSRWRHDERHAAAKLAAYAGRFATKTSPNSVFCATALGSFGPARVAGENVPARTGVLLNIAEARKVAACLGAGPAVRPAVIPRPNPTLRRSEEGWTYWRPASLRLPEDDEVLSTVQENPVLALFLEEAGRGELAVDPLLAAVAEASGYEKEELEGFFEQLVERGILIAELEPPYNARRPLLFVAAAARAAGEVPWMAAVEEVERRVERLSGLDETQAIPEMDEIARHLQSLPHVRPLQADELFRVDQAAALEVALPPRVLDDLAGGLRHYVRLFASMYPRERLLAGWTRPFFSRYGPDVDVPVLDLYHGVFEEAAQPRPAGFPVPSEKRGGEESAFARAQAFFAERARAAAAAGLEEVEIGEEDWRSLLGERPEPRWTAGVLFQVAAPGAEDLEAGRYRIAVNALFSGIGIALTRFADLHGPQGPGNPIAREVTRGLGALERPGAVLAEMTYNHWGRTANAGLRPALLRYEIELPGDRASPPTEGSAEVIPLRDLAVRYDSGRGRFVVRSVSRGLEVVPVLSSGVRPEGVVSFLVELGRQGFQPLSYFPGFEAEGVERWPRFVSGRFVLFRRRWVFRPGRGPRLPQEGTAPDAAAADFFAAVARWRRAHGLPRQAFVHTSKDPKPFYADFRSPLFVDLLRRALEADETPTLEVTEMLPGPEEMWVRDRQGRYASEFLVHLGNPG
jgi:hypothetical protein